MLKKIPPVVLSIVGVVIVAGLVVGGLTLLRGTALKVSDASKSGTNTPKIVNDPANADPNKQEALTTPDLSKDLGACTVITKSMITDAVGNKVAMVADGINRGYAKQLDGSEAQSCTFAFSAANDLNNRYTTTNTVFLSSDQVKTSKAGYEGQTTVSGHGDVAYFQLVASPASPTTVAENDYSLSIFKDLKLYTLTISQPAASDSFTSATAQTALTSIATAAKL